MFSFLKPLLKSNKTKEREELAKELQRAGPIQKKRSWGYATIKKREVPTVKDIVFEAEVIKDEKVVGRRPKLETVKDVNDLTFLENISLYRYYNDIESGRHHDKMMREEYLKNSKSLRRLNTLKFMLLESAKRNLESKEYYSIEIEIDAKYRDELYECMNSKLLSSYVITILKEHDILTKLEVEPILISMRMNA